MVAPSQELLATLSRFDLIAAELAACSGMDILVCALQCVCTGAVSTAEWYFLQELPNLSTLNACHNHLIQFPLAVFSCLYLRLINVSSNSISTFLPPPNTLQHLEVLRMEHNRLEVFPEGLNNRNFPSLRKLYLDSNQIVVLPDDALQMGSITELSLSRNGLTSVPKDFLSSLTGLTVLNLSRNHIGQLHVTTASNLSL